MKYINKNIEKIKMSVKGTLHIRTCPFVYFRKFVKTVGYDEFVEINILEKTTMKSLFEQFSGTYQKESNYVILNFETPDTGNFEIGIYG